jgi:hypothetical protein
VSLKINRSLQTQYSLHYGRGEVHIRQNLIFISAFER